MLAELLKPQTDSSRESRVCDQIYSTSIAQAAFSPLVLLFRKLPLDEARKKHQLHTHTTPTNYT